MRYVGGGCCMEFVVVGWTRLRHQHLVRRNCGAKTGLTGKSAVGAGKVRREYTKKVCTEDVTGSEGREPRVCP